MNEQQQLADSFEIDPSFLPQQGTDNERWQAFRQLLIDRINELIQRDFEKLKWILYRIDISEKKLAEALRHSEADAATVMADLIIERQIQKAESRKKFGDKENDWSFDV